MKDIEKDYLKHGNGKGVINCCLSSTKCEYKGYECSCLASEWKKAKKLYPLNIKYKN